MNTRRALADVLVHYASQVDPKRRMTRSMRMEEAFLKARAELYAVKTELAYPPVTEVRLPDESPPESRSGPL